MNTRPTDNCASGREDPIRDRYYRPWKLSESASSWLFWITACLSFASLFVDKAAFPKEAGAVMTAFAAAVIGYFALGIANRLYFGPRAEGARRKEFISNAYGVGLTHERTSGYYNNEEDDPDRRLAMNVLENAFFTKSVLSRMATSTRVKTIGYLALWIIAATWRETPIDWILGGAQALFSEELLSKWLRLEWYRMRTENLFSTTLAAVRSAPASAKTRATSVEAFADYESTKSVAGILLSENSFLGLNAELSREWEAVRGSLKE